MGAFVCNLAMGMLASILDLNLLKAPLRKEKEMPRDANSTLWGDGASLMLFALFKSLRGEVDLVRHPNAEVKALRSGSVVPHLLLD